MRYRKAGKEQEWELIGIADAPDSPDQKIVILQPEQGKAISIPLAQFQHEYRPVRYTLNHEAIRETLANIRQISTVRFVALPFFLAASAALANAFHQWPWSHEPLLPWLGLGL